MAVGVLFGFVFDLPLVIPVLAASEAAGVALGDGAPLPRLWRQVLAPRLRVHTAAVEALGPWRIAFGLHAALLAAATLVAALAGPALAWAPALAAAALGALAGVGRLCVGCHLHAHWSSR